MDNPFTRQLQYAFQTIASPLGAIGLMVWIGLVIAMIGSPKFKWPVLVLMMWFAAMSFFLENFNVIRLSFPLDQIQNQGRNGSTAFLTALMLPAMLAPPGWRMRRVPFPLLALFIFEMVLSVRIIMAGVTDRGAVSLFIYTMMFVVMAWGVSKWMQDWTSALTVVRCIGWAAGVYIIGVCYQLAVNRDAILRGSRLMGTSGNPQLAALLFSLALPATAYLVARKGEKFWSRVLFSWILAFEIIMLMWTGSRTGILIALTAVLLMFWARLGRLLAVGVLVGVLVLLCLQVYDESTQSLTGMLLRGDTRSHVWRDMLAAFFSAPLMGSMEGSYGVGENSYLSVAASLGFFGLIPLGLFMLATGAALVKLFRIRSVLGEEKAFVDMIIAGVVSLLVGAFFEGFLLGTLTFPVFARYIYLVLAGFALDAADATMQQAAAAELEGEMGEQYQFQGLVGPQGEYVEQYN